MKKTLVILLAGLLTLSLVACGGQQVEDGQSNDSANVEQGKTDKEEDQGKFEYDITDSGDYVITKYETSSIEKISLTLPETVNNIKVVGIAENAFKANKNLTSVIIPNTYTYISDYAFYGCDSLTSVTLPDTIEEIGVSAFQNCYALEDFNLSKAVKEIKEYTFKDCKLLKEMDLTNVEKIQKGAFFNCTALRSLTVSEKLEYAARNAFTGCTALIYKKEADLIYLGYKDNETVLLVQPNPEAITLEECTISNTTTIIADNAFEICDSVTKITLSDNIKYINGTSFTACTNLEYNKSENGLYLGTASNPYMVLIDLDVTTVDGFKLNENTTIIADTAFDDCKNLKNIILSDKLTGISGKTFANCPNLIYNQIDDGYYLGTEENPYMILAELGSITDVSAIVHKDTKIILDTTFKDCSLLKTINFNGTKEEWDKVLKIKGWDEGHNFDITFVEEKTENTENTENK